MIASKSVLVSARAGHSYANRDHGRLVLMELERLNCWALAEVLGRTALHRIASLGEDDPDQAAAPDTS